MIVGIIGVLMIWLGGRAILAGEMTLGDLVMYIFFIGLVAAPLVSIASIGTQITEAFAGLDRIREILDMPTEVDEDAQRAPVERAQRRRRVRRRLVRVQRRASRCCAACRFDAAAGTTTALVGSSGSGKSTLISLVMAFNRPTQGRILIDGRDLAGAAADATTASSWRRCCRRTSCSTARSPRTSATRKPGATLDEIKEACRIAHCDEFISQFPKGYDTVVGERGIKLSGGQRQRVSIARAILANPRILILDEATSSLDSESEQMIQDGLRRLRSGRTTFVIAHRLSTIRSADQILVLEAARSSSAARTRSCWRSTAATGSCTTSSTSSRRDRFINPGEDFTPEPETAGGAAPRVGTRDLDWTTWTKRASQRRAAGACSAARPPARSRRALRYLTGSAGGALLANPTTLLTAAGVAWGIFETMQSAGRAGERLRAG